ncbi:MAG: hypothetical protein JWN20_1421 [Jatrophihabitantaceae bacterium]|nr:hypothetical protein [Jatrophihabitantaceae bacterium]
MDPWAADLLDRLDAVRSEFWLRLRAMLDEDRPAEPEPNAAAVVQPYQWLLRRVGEGLRLTQAGYLPPAIVVEAVAELGWSEPWLGKQNREDTTLPVLELRESAQHMGLLRKSRGLLQVTKAGQAVVEDPQRLWWHIAEQLPLGQVEAEREAGALFALITAAGVPVTDNMIAGGLWQLGWGIPSTGQPMSEFSAGSATRDTSQLFERLGLISERLRTIDEHSLPPSAEAVRLARASLLGRTAEPAQTPPLKPSPKPSTKPSPTQSPKPPSKPSPKAGPAVQLNVRLRDVEPPIWRRIMVPGQSTLLELHSLLQIAMGWQGGHLHQFDIGDELYGDVSDPEAEVLDERRMTVAAAAASGSFVYEYDFGDGWKHDIRVESADAVGDAGSTRILDGARACPPEDCGGPGGYADLLEALADPDHEEHADMLAWVGGEFDPERFDVDEVNARLGRRPRRR